MCCFCCRPCLLTCPSAFLTRPVLRPLTVYVHTLSPFPRAPGHRLQYLPAKLTDRASALRLLASVFQSVTICTVWLLFLNGLDIWPNCDLEGRETVSEDTQPQPHTHTIYFWPSDLLHCRKGFCLTVRFVGIRCVCTVGCLHRGGGRGSSFDDGRGRRSRRPRSVEQSHRRRQYHAVWGKPRRVP